jgi:hypothetical protein
MPAFLILGMVLVTAIVLLSVMLIGAERRSNPDAARRDDSSGDSPMVFVDGGSSFDGGSGADCSAGDAGCGDGGDGGGGGGGD